MKKLHKKNANVATSVEAYACSCYGTCSAQCGCSCAIIFGDKSGALSDAKAAASNADKAAEAKSSNYKK